MADVDVRVSVDESAVRRVIEALQLRLQPSALKEFLVERAHPALRRSAEERFANEGDAAVGKWAELAFATGRVRSYLGYQPFHPINVRSGALKNFVLNTYTVKQLAAGASLLMPGPASGELLSKFRVAQQGGFGTGGTTRAGFGRGSASAVGGGMSVPVGEPGRPAGPNRPAPARPVIAITPRDYLEIPMSLLDWIRQGIF